MKDNIDELKRTRDKLARQQAQLAKDHQRLLLQTSLLSAWCDTLTLLQAKWGAAQPSAADAGADAEQQQDSAVQEQFGQLLHEEVELLNELLANDRQLANSSACTAALPDPGPDALAQGDPMEYLRRILVAGPYPEAAEWTTADLAGMLREAILQSSCQLSPIELPASLRACCNLLPPKQLWDRWLRAQVSVFMLGRYHVLERISFYNLATMEPSPECEAASTQVNAALLQRVALTETQKDLIAMGYELFTRIITPQRQQWQEVTTQIQAADAAAAAAAVADGAIPTPPHVRGTPTSSSSSLLMQPTAAALAAAAAAAQPCRPSSSGSSRCRRAVGVLRGFDATQQLLEERQQLAARLKVLLAKDYMLALALEGVFYGCLTYEQLSLFGVLCWPYNLRPVQLAHHICKLRAQELASSSVPPQATETLQMDEAMQGQEQEQQQQRRRRSRRSQQRQPPTRV